MLGISSKLNTAFFIDPDNHLIVEVLTGRISFNNLKAYKEYQASCPDYNPDYDLITVVKETVFDLLLNEVNEYFQFVKNHKNTIAGKRKAVVILNTPNQEVYYRLYKRVQEELPQTIGIYYSVDDGIAFLGRESIDGEIKSKIHSLRDNPTHQW